ncbi:MULTISPECIES: diheme cytochrome c [Arcobacter]|uniref:Cytochrome C n=1 Tax=Arcobacter ellisii TaxID=913109 RepID=A0A347UC60_9BACT|nr:MULTISPECIES: diheme cytochrome c [Arcobacter]AXX96438.1 diheme cytochrome c [Arcobacter ellisii]MDD3007301.1 diheme cytochrome c [Arcobacter sp.]RXI32893.1 cytochrome C [Arcobacter ellisii]
MKYLIFLGLMINALFAEGYSSTPDVAPVKNDLYIKECGSCHFPYQPGLLPSNAWEKMMANLDNHFNSDATLDDKTFQTLSKYLNDNSAEKNMQYKRSNRIVSSIPAGQIADSISTTPYMIKKHREIRKDLITQKEVKGLFNCIACHTTADKGIYSERDIKIPNFGKWEDD